MAEVPLFPTTRSPVLTYLPYLEFRLYGGSTTLTTFRMGARIASHIEEHQPLLLTTTDFLDSGLDGGGSRIGICFKSDAKLWNTSGYRRIHSDHGFSYIVLCPDPGTTNTFKVIFIKMRQTEVSFLKIPKFRMECYPL